MDGGIDAMDVMNGGKQKLYIVSPVCLRYYDCFNISCEKECQVRTLIIYRNDCGGGSSGNGLGWFG